MTTPEFPELPSGRHFEIAEGTIHVQKGDLDWTARKAERKRMAKLGYQLEHSGFVLRLNGTKPLRMTEPWGRGYGVEKTIIDTPEKAKDYRQWSARVIDDGKPILDETLTKFTVRDSFGFLGIGSKYHTEERPLNKVIGWEFTESRTLVATPLPLGFGPEDLLAAANILILRQLDKDIDLAHEENGRRVLGAYPPKKLSEEFPSA